jgi:hypothetical protein
LKLLDFIINIQKATFGGSIAEFVKLARENFGSEDEDPFKFEGNEIKNRLLVHTTGEEFFNFVYQ